MKIDAETISEHRSHSSGCGSGHDSISWHRTSRSELSNTDSGAELEPPVMIALLLFVNAFFPLKQQHFYFFR